MAAGTHEVVRHSTAYAERIYELSDCCCAMFVRVAVKCAVVLQSARVALQ